MRRIEHSGFGFALEVPDAWRAAELPEGLLAAAEDEPGDLSIPPGFAVTVTDLPDGPHDPASLSEQGLMAEARWLTDLHVLDEEDVELPGGLSARRTLATYRQGMSSVTLEQWHAVHDGRVLALSAMGPTADYAALHDVWHAIVGSLALDDDG
jgi:hypothetical protein